MTPPHKPERPLTERLRRRAGGVIIDGFFRGLSSAARLAPMARPQAHDVRVHSDIPYGDSDAPHHRLDVYEPLGHAAPHPVVLYAHGGGFRILSKDTHWMMALAFARRGYLTFNLNYRLAPEHPYPAAIADVCQGYAWILEHLADWGGDPERVIVAGESAGANLVTGLTLASCYQRPEPWARQVWELERVPAAVLAACGIHQVSDVARLHRRRPLPRWLLDRLEEVHEGYLPSTAGTRTVDTALADPLLLLERGVAPERPLPPFFAPVGTKDPLLDDTRRLARALEALEVPVTARYYEGEVHAFHALLWRANARRCWADTFRFLGDHGLAR